MRNDITIRQETHKDYKKIISLVLRSFKEGTNNSDGIDVIALIEEIRDSEYYIPELSFVAELDGEIVRTEQRGLSLLQQQYRIEVGYDKGNRNGQRHWNRKCLTVGKRKDRYQDISDN